MTVVEVGALTLPPSLVKSTTSPVCCLDSDTAMVVLYASGFWVNPLAAPSVVGGGAGARRSNMS